MVAEVEQAQRRSGMPVRESLSHLEVSRSSYYRWKREESWKQERRQVVVPVQAFEALPEEKHAVREYALAHPEVRHRELSWRMIDEEVVCLSSSTVYRILRESRLMQRQRGRKKRYRDEPEKASVADEIWATDLMYLKVGGQQYYLITFIDEFSRHVVHHELLSSMDADAISVAAERALESLPRDDQGELTVKPMIRSDNGSGYVSQEFGGLLEHHGLTHHRIRPHCPEENGVVERMHRTLRERIEEHELDGRYDSEEVIRKVVQHYNEERLHSSLEYQTPATWYRGNPEAVRTARRAKLSAARHRRKEINLGVRQRTLPYPSPQSAP